MLEVHGTMPPRRAIPLHRRPTSSLRSYGRNWPPGPRVSRQLARGGHRQPRAPRCTSFERAFVAPVSTAIVVGLRVSGRMVGVAEAVGGAEFFDVDNCECEPRGRNRRFKFKSAPSSESPY